MSIKAKNNLYNKNSQINEKSLCDFFCKLSINENINNKTSISSLDTIQDSTNYISDYISVSSDDVEYKINEKSSEYQGKLTYSKTNYTFSIYNWSGLIKYLIGKEPSYK